jgi:hypothetical protein
MALKGISDPIPSLLTECVCRGHLFDGNMGGEGAFFVKMNVKMD